MTPEYVGRFAPSPTGDLHFGSLVAALGSWLRARAQRGTWLIRVEDIDPPREVPGSTARIIATLAAFGMSSDGPVVLQSARPHQYEAALAHLVASGVAFPCACSRKQLEGTAGRHRLACLPPAADVAHAWRARVPDTVVGFTDQVIGSYQQTLRADVGDFVLRRVDGHYAYQLAVVVDDAAQGVTEVVRGADLLDSTPRQIWLQQMLGLPTPHYLHLPLVLDEHGHKLGKSSSSMPVDASNPLPALRAALAALGQEVHATCTTRDTLLQAAVAAFDVRRIPAAIPSRTEAVSD
jgi:glutamyl-Q tRNA(Asp) synthetase